MDKIIVNPKKNLKIFHLPFIFFGWSGQIFSCKILTNGFF